MSLRLTSELTDNSYKSLNSVKISRVIPHKTEILAPLVLLSLEVGVCTENSSLRDTCAFGGLLLGLKALGIPPLWLVLDTYIEKLGLFIVSIGNSLEYIFYKKFRDASDAEPLKVPYLSASERVSKLKTAVQKVLFSRSAE